jgi:osmoprotectant transport system ATP-binding protein
MLKKVNLDPNDFMNRMPNELSGGEAQRVGIVRALIFDPKIILMDEPFSALDPLARRQLQKLVLALHQEFKTTIVFVTHDMQEALNLSSRLAILNNGFIQQVGTPDELINQPANNFVANFFYNADTEKDYIKSILDAGLGNPVNTREKGNQYLKVTDTIYELAKTLQLSEDNTVIVNDQQLTTSDLMQYLALQAETKL